jgi:hypothetical protein
LTAEPLSSTRQPLDHRDEFVNGVVAAACLYRRLNAAVGMVFE